MTKENSYTIILGNKIWKHGGKRKHRTFQIEATSEIDAKKKALMEFKLLGVSWKPVGAEARLS